MFLAGQARPVSAMAKVINRLQCPECMDFLAGVKGAPLTRIACANCQQAKQDSKGRARSNHGPELKSTLWALKRGEVIVMSEVVVENSVRLFCPEMWEGLYHESGAGDPLQGTCDGGGSGDRGESLALCPAVGEDAHRTAGGTRALQDCGTSALQAAGGQRYRTDGGVTRARVRGWRRGEI